MKKIFFLFIFFFIGCNNTNSSKSTCIDVFTLAPVVNAIVTDKTGKSAVYENFQYCFDGKVTYPVSVKATNDTFIDVNYNGKKDPSDVLPSQYFLNNPLKTFCKNANYFTTIIENNQIENNETNTTEINSTLVNLINSSYNFDMCGDYFDKNNAKALFAIYDYVINNNKLPHIIEIYPNFYEISKFFDKYPNIVNIPYVSYYKSLVYLDKRLLKRSDSIHKPEIPLYLRNNITILDGSLINNPLDIIENNDFLYIASGEDELAALNKYKFSLGVFSNSPFNSYGSKLYLDNNCLYLADGKIGIGAFEIDKSSLIKEGYFNRYYINDNGQIKEANLTNDKLIGINGYHNENLQKNLLIFNTTDNGFFLVKKENFINCLPTINKFSDNILLNVKGYSIDSAFKKDGTFVYITMKDQGIVGLDITNIDSNIIKNSQKNFALATANEAYKLKLFNSDNSLIVSTDKGIEIYNILNNNDLSFVDNYISEGSIINYFPSIDTYKDFILFTDGFKGLKILKFANNKLMLCGVVYFAVDSNKLAQVNSIKVISENNEVYLIIGVYRYGVVKIKLDDALFLHCKE